MLSPRQVKNHIEKAVPDLRVIRHTRYNLEEEDRRAGLDSLEYKGKHLFSLSAGILYRYPLSWYNIPRLDGVCFHSLEDIAKKLLKRRLINLKQFYLLLNTGG